MLAAHGAWAVGLRHYPTSYWGATVSSTGLVLLALIVASLPAAALLQKVARRIVGTKPAATVAPAPAGAAEVPPAALPQRSVVTLDRRAYVQGVAALAPAVSLGLGVRGFCSAEDEASMGRQVTFAFPDLHPDLDGFTILQLSDLHLGMTKHVRDLETFLSSLDGAGRRPDLIVFTGDVAEDLSQLAPALSLASQLRPRAGVFASLGNHEYLRDIRASRPIYEKSPVPLLVDAASEVRVGGARLAICGVDDPVRTHGDIRTFMRDRVERATRDASTSAFRLLLAHRPEAYDHAAKGGIELTLSGHTHGGQIGFNDKSAFEPLYPDGYLWGAYTRGRSRLYTTAGFGDWFPFRLGCPREAPRIVLRRARV
jgi:predicted MPP superfamily phosphohydrolase